MTATESGIPPATRPPAARPVAKGVFRGIKRPRRCTEVATERVCSLIRHGLGLREIAARDGMPTLDTLGEWFAGSPKFRAAYDLARQFQSEVFADDVIALAAAVAESEVAPTKLRIDARKWRSAQSRKQAEKVGADAVALDAEIIAQLEAGAERTARLREEAAARAAAAAEPISRERE